jgi:hypothetical protein
VIAFFTDESRLGENFRAFNVTPATRELHGRFQQKNFGISDRDSLTRHVITKHGDGSIMESARSIDEAKMQWRTNL